MCGSGASWDLFNHDTTTTLFLSELGQNLGGLRWLVAHDLKITTWQLSKSRRVALDQLSEKIRTIHRREVHGETNEESTGLHRLTRIGPNYSAVKSKRGIIRPSNPPAFGRSGREDTGHGPHNTDRDFPGKPKRPKRAVYGAFKMGTISVWIGWPVTSMSLSPT
jgi:hypothetical protein